MFYLCRDVIETPSGFFSLVTLVVLNGRMWERTESHLTLNLGKDTGICGTWPGKGGLSRQPSTTSLSLSLASAYTRAISALITTKSTSENNCRTNKWRTDEYVERYIGVCAREN